MVKTTFFHDKFGVEQFEYNSSLTGNAGWSHPMLNSIIYLQVSVISQALIFITRSRTFFFLERPSIILVGAFILAQLIATFIAVWAHWSFTDIAGCGWRWAGIVWVWNLIWFFPLDLLKVKDRGIEIEFYVYRDFSLLFVNILIPKQKRVIEESLETKPSTDEQRLSRQNSVSNPPSRRLSRMTSDQERSRRDQFAEVTARYYTPHTQHLSTAHRHRNFARLFSNKNNQQPTFTMIPNELRRFSLVQVKT